MTHLPCAIAVAVLCLALPPRLHRSSLWISPCTHTRTLYLPVAHFSPSPYATHTVPFYLTTYKLASHTTNRSKSFC
ncbi:hypothetical protein EDB84DRAFT_1495963 [Lactarius hengduanensis]|nr:hypothetical protein EDB84DRAFT_1495963 [Lactarius hengduanensis]